MKRNSRVPAKREPACSTRSSAADELAQRRASASATPSAASAGVPDAHPEDAGAHHGVARRLVERVEAHLDRRLDRRRRAHVLAGGDDARQLLGEERRARGLLRDLVEHRVGRAGADHGAGDLARGAPGDGAELDAHVVAPDEALALAPPERRAHQHQHEERLVAGAAEEVVDPGDRLGVGPLRVLDEERAGLDARRRRARARSSRARARRARRAGSMPSGKGWLARRRARRPPSWWWSLRSATSGLGLLERRALGQAEERAQRVGGHAERLARGRTTRSARA